MLSRKPYSVRADCFSVGCIYYRLLTGLRPFGDEGATLTFARNRKCKFHLEGAQGAAFMEFTTAESRSLVLKLVTESDQERLLVEDAKRNAEGPRQCRRMCSTSSSART